MTQDRKNNDTPVSQGQGKIPSAVPPGKINMETMPLKWKHIRIVLIASLGQLIGQGLATLVGIVIPLMQLAIHPELSSGMQGLMGCISLIGIMIGTVVFGRLSDRYGYLLFFRLCPLIIILTSLTAVWIHTVPVLLVCLFLMGFAVGGEYSLDGDYISELMPEKWRIYMVGVAKALASAGSAIVAIAAYLLINHWQRAEPWPDLFLIMSVIAAVMLLLRLGFAQSPAWLMERGKVKQAEKAVEDLLGADVYMPVPEKTSDAPQEEGSLLAFVKRNFSKAILTGIPWACEGLGVYGIGIFLPILIMSFGLDQLPATATEIEHVTHSVGLTFVLCIVMMVGFGFGILLLRKMNHLSMQTAGFWGSAAGLTLLLAAYHFHWPDWLAIGGFVLFELFLNAGPHLITFILPTRIYPVADRGTGAGVAASLGKSGAVIGAFLIPVLLRWGGATLVLFVSIGVMIAGALITQIMGRVVARKNHVSPDDL